MEKMKKMNPKTSIKAWFVNNQILSDTTSLAYDLQKIARKLKVTVSYDL